MKENLLLTLDDAVTVAMNYIHNHCDDYGIDKEDEKLLRSEMEQKCWLTRCDNGSYYSTRLDARKRLVELIMDVRPVEICSQVERDNLKDWCESWQVAAQLALMKV